ncbi:glucose PTS transporter transcription antiterminator GlcT [Salimicrobium halophilum]|uniref:Transcriptional antiterminator, BglG family n=1 Tax=Salimicrobium halophilum TaxID=86666 RepID=A0A1G8WTP1_9BACI|nr:PRD domain-containing protein [Salimicrobium halophilum]SDJ81523.1 transcriptional antiterminator, BglG family [Salimicrobium halophilum]
MERPVTVKKTLNNNVIIAEHPAYKEVILIGKGIGFNRKTGDEIEPEIAEKTFLLRDPEEKQQYVNLLPHVSEELIPLMSDVLNYVEERMEEPLHEHIHVALTDHLAFAFHRAKNNLEFSNPFLSEIETLYPKEYQIALEVVTIVYDKTGVQFPMGEVGFIALHIHSAVTDKSLREINRHNRLITQLVHIIEEQLEVTVDRKSIDYHRLVQHLHRAIHRIYTGETVGDQTNLDNMLKKEYPLCYNLSWKLIKVMQRQLNRTVDESEAVYLTIHLQRLTQK